MSAPEERVSTVQAAKRVRWTAVMVFASLLALSGLSWRLAAEYRRQMQRRTDPLSRLLVIGTRTTPGEPATTTSLQVLLRNISPAGYQRVTLAASSHTPGKERWEGKRDFSLEISSGATVLLPEWNLPVEQGIGTTFECRVVEAH